MNKSRVDRARDQLVSLLAMLLAHALFLPAKLDAEETGARERPPNVLLLMCDQLAARVLSCYDGPVETPHIDRLAREGVRFTGAVCPTPFCSPTRASIITGMYPHAHGIVANVNHQPGDTRQRGISAADLTTEKILHAAGYATHHYGKWHLSAEPPSYYSDMFRPGFEYAREMQEVFSRVRGSERSRWMKWYGWALPVTVSAPMNKAVQALGNRWDNQRLAEFITRMGRLELPLEQVYDRRITSRTVKKIRTLSRGEKPFMITCSFNAPHDPNVVPSPYYERFDPAAIELPANREVREKRFEKEWSRRIVADLGEPGLREFLRVYYGMVAMIDDQVGELLAVLDQAGVIDDTIVVFTADHGDMAGGHGMVWKSTSAFYDEVVRVPLLIRSPRHLKPQICDLAVDLTDLMPTLLDLLGRPIPEQVQGQSLVPFLTGKRPLSEARKYSFAERIPRHPRGLRKDLPSRGAAFMIRGQGWKYIRYRQDEEYLYQLSADPGETRNLSGEPRFEARRQALAAAMEAWLRTTNF